MKIITITLILLLPIMVSCEKNKTAEGALSDFISYRFEENQKRGVLLEKTHGRLKNLIAAMDEQEFKKYITVDQLRKKSYKIVLENCKNDICFITYNLNYIDYKDNQKREEQFNIEVKKIAKLEKNNDEWLISDVQNIKTYINSKEKIDISDKDILERNSETSEETKKDE